MLCPHHDIKIVQRSNRRSLSERRTVVFRVRPEAEILCRETRDRPHRNHAAAPRPAGVRRPQHLVERRRSRRKTMELPACPKDRTCHTEGNSPVTARRPDPGLLPGVFCFQRHDCRFCHSRQGGRESPCPHPADHPGNGRNREMASQEPEGL